MCLCVTSLSLSRLPARDWQRFSLPRWSLPPAQATPPTASRAQSDSRVIITLHIHINCPPLNIPRDLICWQSALLTLCVVQGSSVTRDTCKHGNENTCIECNLVTSTLYIATWHDIVISINITTFTPSWLNSWSCEMFIIRCPRRYWFWSVVSIQKSWMWILVLRRCGVPEEKEPYTENRRQTSRMPPVTIFLSGCHTRHTSKRGEL